MSLRLLFLLPFFTLVTVAGPARPIQVAVSIYPIQAIAEKIGGDRVTVRTIIPPHADPHHFEPTPSVVRSLQKSRVFFGIAPEFDGWVRKFLPSTCHLVFLMQPDQSNEHIWLSLSGGHAIGTRIAEVLSEIDPNGIHAYQDRLTAFRSALQKARISITTLLKPLQNRSFVQYHPAWNLFAAEFGLTIAGTITHGHHHQPSPGELISLIRMMRKKHVSVIVTGLEPTGSAVKTLMEETGSKQVQLDPLGGPDKPGFQHYPEMLVSNARLLAGALQ